MKRATQKIIIFAVLLFGFSTPAFAQNFTYTEIPGMAGDPWSGDFTSAAMAISNSGYVAGYAMAIDGSQHAFLWKDGVMTDLGKADGTHSTSEDVNSSGEVAGIMYNPTYPFLYSDGQISLIGPPPSSGNSYGFGINEAGDVVGELNGSAFLYQNGVVKDLGLFGGDNSCAFAVNNAGQVVGYSLNTDGSSPRAFIWKNGQYTQIQPLGGDYSSSYATDVNDAGQVVGYSSTPDNDTHAFLWENGIISDLGMVVGVSIDKKVAINNSGQIITRKFFYDSGVVVNVADLLPLSVQENLVWAELKDINDAGQLVGFTMRFDPVISVTRVRAFVLTPTTLCE